jgi:hypothetical protein
MSLNQPAAGEYFTPAYQVSAMPFVTSSVINSGEIHKYEFPYVTRFIDIVNRGNGANDKIAIGFTENGLTKTYNYITLDRLATVNEEIRTTVLYVSCSSGNKIDYQLFCGLTTIPAKMFLILSASNGHPGVG